eukprot:gene28277-31479_t
MILGMSVANFTLLHVIISLVGIGTGLIVVGDMLANRRLGFWNALFLVTTILTSVTGFFFHSTSFGPPHIVGLLSLCVLIVAVSALYVGHLAGYARAAYVVSAMIALYFNIFVSVVQAFQKIPALAAYAPTQSEPPFAITQAVVLAIAVIATILALVRFQPAGAR